MEQLGWYANQALPVEEHAEVDAHLAQCAACRGDVEEWSGVRAAMYTVHMSTPQPRADLFSLLEQQLDRSESRSIVRQVLHITGLRVMIVCEHLWAQLRLIRRDLWWMPLILMPLTALLATTPYHWQNRASILAFTGALITALSMAFLYGQEADPAREMTLVTPTSPRLILCTRGCVVFGYNLLINLAGVLPIMLSHSAITPMWLLANWFAPLCCLAAIALLISTLINAATAVFTCALLWILRALSDPQMIHITFLPQQYEDFWHQGPLLLAIAAIAVSLTFICLERRERFNI
jgi:Putative zinc-finger